MHHRACVALARAHPELYKLVALQRAVVLGVLEQALLRKLLELASLLKKVIDTHFAAVLRGINLIAVSIDGNCKFSVHLRR
jgi:hypothetical protein